MIKKIELKNFRLFSSFVVDDLQPLVILSGKNAVGKTSILESVYLCSTTKSHRTNNILNLIKENSDFLTVDIKDDKDLKVVVSKEGKSLFINNHEIKRISDFIGNLNVVMFSPSDLELILGSKQVRRKFLDLEISLLNKKYLSDISNYKKLLSKRNEILKSKDIDLVLLDVITSNLIEFLKRIYDERILFLKEINEYLKVISSSLNIGNISLNYQKTYDENNLLKSFKDKEKQDFFNKATTIGIHRDDMLINIDNHLAYEYASEGQKRAICIAIKIALKEYMEKRGKNVILLLDDVFASLDAKRIKSLVSYVKNATQVFITTTSTLEIPNELLKVAQVIRIENKGE